MPDKTPRRLAAFSRLPVRSVFHASTRAHAVAGLFTRSCPSSVGFIASPRHRSLRGFPSSPAPLFLHATACRLRRTSTHSPFTRASSRLPGLVPRRHPRVCDLEAVPALQGARPPLRPTGFSVYACPVSCSRLAPLRNRTNTRYGWVASPYPTGTFTRQETPSFARR